MQPRRVRTRTAAGRNRQSFATSSCRAVSGHTEGKELNMKLAEKANYEVA